MYIVTGSMYSIDIAVWQYLARAGRRLAAVSLDGRVLADRGEAAQAIADGPLARVTFGP